MHEWSMHFCQSGGVIFTGPPHSDHHEKGPVPISAEDPILDLFHDGKELLGVEPRPIFIQKSFITLTPKVASVFDEQIVPHLGGLLLG